jgi:hypothetical protein
MDEVKHASAPTQNRLGIDLQPRIGMLGQALQIPNEVGEAELDQTPHLTHELAVGAEVITAEHPVEVAPQHLQQHLRSPGA